MVAVGWTRSRSTSQAPGAAAPRARGRPPRAPPVLGRDDALEVVVSSMSAMGGWRGGDSHHGSPDGRTASPRILYIPCAQRSTASGQLTGHHVLPAPGAGSSCSPAPAFAATAVPAAAHGRKPETPPVPNGFQPEGIATVDEDDFLVGSIRPAPVTAHLRSQRARCSPRRRGSLSDRPQVDQGRCSSPAAQPRGPHRDAADGIVLRDELGRAAGPTFVNDVAGRRALHHRLAPVQIDELPDDGRRRGDPLTGISAYPAANNLNGIVARASGARASVQSRPASFGASTRRRARRPSSTLGCGDDEWRRSFPRHGALSVAQNRDNEIV